MTSFVWVQHCYEMVVALFYYKMINVGKINVIHFFSLLSKGWNAQLLLQKMQVLIYPVVFLLDMEKHYSIHFHMW